VLRKPNKTLLTGAEQLKGDIPHSQTNAVVFRDLFMILEHQPDK
jgi:hypothetical protein